MLENLRLSSFSPHVGEIFTLCADAQLELELELISAEAIASGGRGPTKSGDTREPFSLLFKGPGEQPLAQRIYEFRHDRMGTLNIFIVPVGRDERGMLYEAIFN